jgi:aromatic-L-amino-acid decarboxylase
MVQGHGRASGILLGHSLRHGLGEHHARPGRGEGSGSRLDDPGEGHGRTLYASENAQSSVEKAAVCLGIGLENVRKIRLDELGRLDAADLRSRIAADLESGSRPFCAVATIGTTSTTAVDPVREIAALCAEHEMWLHVDAAYAGPAAVLPENAAAFRWMGSGRFVVINPHKWLFTPIDCSAFYTRRPDVLRRAFQLVPEYLRTPETEASGQNLMDYGIQLGRRFRGLKLWFVLRYFGLRIGPDCVSISAWRISPDGSTSSVLRGCPDAFQHNMLPARPEFGGRRWTD